MNENNKNNKKISLNNGRNENSNIFNNYENDLLQKRINYSSTIYKNFLLKNKNNINNQRSLSSAKMLEAKKHLQENVHVKMNKLFNEYERKILAALFKSDEEFEYFNQKINVNYFF